MKIDEAYNNWADSYDSMVNKTRDLEQVAARKTLSDANFSTEMLRKAREKIKFKNIEFKQADITQEWGFMTEQVDLVTCSLVLEHINNLEFIFNQASKTLHSGGLFTFVNYTLINNIGVVKPDLKRIMVYLNWNAILTTFAIT